MTESERFTFETELGISIDKNEDCHTMSTRLITPKSEQFLSVLSDTVEENRLMSICGVSYGRGIIEDAKQLSFCTPRPYLGYLVEAQNLILKGYSPSDVLSYFDTKLYERRSVT